MSYVYLEFGLNIAVRLFNLLEKKIIKNVGLKTSHTGLKMENPAIGLF